MSGMVQTYKLLLPRPQGACELPGRTTLLDRDSVEANSSFVLCTREGSAELLECPVILVPKLVGTVMPMTLRSPQPVLQTLVLQPSRRSGEACHFNLANTSHKQIGASALGQLGGYRLQAPAGPC